MDPIPIEDLALLEVLKRIDEGEELSAPDQVIRQRLYDSGLAAGDGGEWRLTAAGVELCKSLQHRLAADRQVEKILHKRDDA